MDRSIFNHICVTTMMRFVAGRSGNDDATFVSRLFSNRRVDCNDLVRKCGKRRDTRTHDELFVPECAFNVIKHDTEQLLLLESRALVEPVDEVQVLLLEV